jgi:AraC-like DNA-binding protein
MTKLKFCLFFLFSLLTNPAHAQQDITQQKIDSYISQAKFDSAKIYIQTKLNDRAQEKNVSSLSYQLVKVLFIQSDYREALKQAFNALDMIDDKKEAVNLNFIVGCIYSAIKDYDKSIEYFDLVVKHTGDSSMLVKSHLLTSELHLELGDSTLARASLGEAYNITQVYGLDSKLKSHVAMQYNFFSQNYELCKQQNLKVIADSTSFLNAKSYAFSMIGDCLVRQDSLSEAVKYFDAFLELTFQTKDPEQVKVAAKKLIDTYEEMGIQEKANAYHKIYNEAVSDSLSFSVEKYRELYDIEKNRELDSAKDSRNYLLLGLGLGFLLLVSLGTYGYFKRRLSGPEAIDLPQKAPGKKIVVSDVEIEKIKAAIDQLIAEQLFLTPKITRKSFCVAHEIKSERYLSHYINTAYKKSFSIFINDLRVEYAYDRIQNDGTFRHYRIEEIAKESGFGSKKSFERAFAAKYKETPYKLISQLIN